MAFVTIDNPGGVLHHGGQMAWDAVSNTRVVMVTITADFKALIQEINQVSGAPVVGTPNFIAQLPDGAQSWYHHRPKIKSMGNGLVFVMVPTAWAGAGNIDAGWGSSLSIAAPTNTTTLRSQCVAPYMYTGYVMERNASGQYSVKSSTQIDTRYVSAGVTNVSTNALNISSASTTSIKITKALNRDSSSGLSYYLPILTITIPVTNGILGVATSTLPLHKYIGNFTNYMFAAELKNVKDINGVETEIVVPCPNGSTLVQSSGDRGIWTFPIFATLYHDCYVLAGGSNYSTLVKGILLYLTPNGFAIPDATKRSDYYAIGGGTSAQGVSYNSNYLSQPTLLTNPLDTGWLTSDGVLCVVGGTQSNAAPYMCFDCDLAAHLRATYIGGLVDTVVPLQMSFRLPVGAGQYSGPFDPIVTPYFYKERTNNNKVLHRVDDTHFWLIGCFMADENADQKLGVISVSA